MDFRIEIEVSGLRALDFRFKVEDLGLGLNYCPSK